MLCHAGLWTRLVPFGHQIFGELEYSLESTQEKETRRLQLMFSFSCLPEYTKIMADI